MGRSALGYLNVQIDTVKQNEEIMSIYIVGHKPTPLPSAEFYRPIAVGGNHISDHELRDDEGENNISRLNKFYCELTATYWLWKNTSSDIIGICHYRRFFNLIPTNHYQTGWLNMDFNENALALLNNPMQYEKIKDILGHYDLIIPRTTPCAHSLRENYLESQSEKEWDIFTDQLDLLYGRHNHGIYVENRNIYGNMLICKREVFEHYCQQLFFIIDRVFAEVGEYPEKSNVRYQPYRYPGYLSERFTSAFIHANRLRAYEAQIFVFNDL